MAARREREREREREKASTVLHPTPGGMRKVGKDPTNIAEVSTRCRRGSIRVSVLPQW